MRKLYSINSNKENANSQFNSLTYTFIRETLQGVTCPFCNEEAKSTEHFPCECPAYGPIRHHIFRVDVLRILWLPSNVYRKINRKRFSVVKDRNLAVSPYSKRFWYFGSEFGRFLQKAGNTWSVLLNSVLEGVKWDRTISCNRKGIHGHDTQESRGRAENCQFYPVTYYYSL